MKKIMVYMILLLLMVFIVIGATTIITETYTKDGKKLTRTATQSVVDEYNTDNLQNEKQEAQNAINDIESNCVSSKSSYQSRISEIDKLLNEYNKLP